MGCQFWDPGLYFGTELSVWLDPQISHYFCYFYYSDFFFNLFWPLTEEGLKGKYPIQSRVTGLQMCQQEI